MKTVPLVIASLFLAACGGKAKSDPPPQPPALADDDAGEEVEPIEDQPVEDEPAPLQRWEATAELVAVKGQKMKPGIVRFSQVEGAAVDVMADSFEGLKAGRYHLVIHTSGDCGKNATKAGPAWPETAATTIDLEVTKQDPGGIEENGADLSLEGERSIVGRTLVLHADKKGKPGAAVACGPIVAGADD